MNENLSNPNRLLSGEDWVCHVVYTDDSTNTVYVEPKATEERAVFTAARFIAAKANMVKTVTSARRWQVDPHFRNPKG